MDARTFLGPEPTHNPFRWKLPVTDGISTTGNFLFGGSGLGAAISAMEGTSGRECVWATAQYLSYAKQSDVVDIDVTTAVDGHQTTRARAVCHVADRAILTVNAALGNRPMEYSGQWQAMPPDLPRPEDCPPQPSTANQVEKDFEQTAREFQRRRLPIERGL
jgi:acyl-CoA thioesterase-2